MGKKSTETVETRIDPGAERYRDYVYGEARKVADIPFQAYTGQRVAGMDPNTAAGFQALMRGDPSMNAALSGIVSNLGLTSGPLNVGEFMNPYLDEVIGGVRSDFDRMRESSLNAVGADATSAGAFGGSRHGIAEAMALGEVAREEGRTIGDLRASGYQSAVANALQNRAQLGGLGLSAAQMLNRFQTQQGMAGVQMGELQRGINQTGLDANFQEFMRRINMPAQNLGLLQGVMSSSPYGQTQTTTSEGNWMNTLAGLAATGASLFGGPPGALATQGVQGLLSSGGGGPNITPNAVPIQRRTLSFIPANFSYVGG